MMLDLWPGQLVPTSPYDQECRELADRHYNRQSPSPDRWRERSRTYTGIAEAMAEQWGQEKGRR